ncbi:MAG TPA: 4'-phosphopantetheinyl transferase superfamily protein [Pyrinomonadaceae bacterium]|nr:4'-phosphopantetheinyl transferase superfamily protein [Pyrinomonadaceae bacterium]
MATTDDQPFRNPEPCSYALAEDDVHVWRVPTDVAGSEVEALSGLLSREERDRAARFRFKRDGDRFTVSRGRLRMLLSLYTGLEAGRIEFLTNEFGKPSLGGDAARAGLRFNAAHSHELALYAFARWREVGVDVERVREDFDCEAVAANFFAPGEVEALRAPSARRGARAFFDCWTRKEAYVKARGEGLSRPLDSSEVSLEPGAAASLLRAGGDAVEAARWALFDLDAGEGYAAALVVEGRGSRLECRRWPGSGATADLA